MTTFRTMCPMNCHPTLCGVEVNIENNRVVSVTGDEKNPCSKGFICGRGKASAEIPHSPQRVLHPLYRESIHDEFSRIPWADAFDLMYQGLKNPRRAALWAGHGAMSNNYGTRIYPQLINRFANQCGALFWDPSIICWGLGAFGLHLTGLTETTSGIELANHSDLIIMWGADFSSQPLTAQHVLAAKKRGATLISIDVRGNQTTKKCDENYVIRPGTDAALAVGLMCVIVEENLINKQFIQKHTVGFDKLKNYLVKCDLDNIASNTGITTSQIQSLARQYASAGSSCIMLGGSSMHKGSNGWNASRAISSLPALTGQVGRPGAGLGPRHGGWPHGSRFLDISARKKYEGSSEATLQMANFLQKLNDKAIDSLFLFGSNIASSFANTNELKKGLRNLPLIVCHDLFTNETSKEYAHLLLPSTTWLEEIGCKRTENHLHLMEQIQKPIGEAKSVYDILSELSSRLDLTDFNIWHNAETLVDHAIREISDNSLNIAELRKNGGHGELKVGTTSHPEFVFDTPTQKLELWSRRAEEHNLAPIPTSNLPTQPHDAINEQSYTLTFGRTMDHFHAFYNHGRAIPSMKQHDQQPVITMNREDATSLGVDDADVVVIYNELGEFTTSVKLSEEIPRGVLWSRSGWQGLNQITRSDSVIGNTAIRITPVSSGQSSFVSNVKIRIAKTTEKNIFCSKQ